MKTMVSLLHADTLLLASGGGEAVSEWAALLYTFAAVCDVRQAEVDTDFEAEQVARQQLLEFVEPENIEALLEMLRPFTEAYQLKIKGQ